MASILAAVPRDNLVVIATALWALTAVTLMVVVARRKRSHDDRFWVVYGVVAGATTVAVAACSLLIHALDRSDASANAVAVFALNLVFGICFFGTILNTASIPVVLVLQLVPLRGPPDQT